MKKKVKISLPRDYDDDTPYFCGIDLGVTGAIAFLDESGHNLKVYDMPTLTVSSGRKSKKTGKMGKKKILDFAGIKKLLLDYEPELTVVEKPVISRDAREGRTSIATTHMNAGIVVGMLFGLGYSYTEMRPQEWQKVFFKGVKGDAKKLSYDTVCKLFPKKSHFFIGPKGGIKDGRSDATLIAEIAKRLYFGGIN